jgi:hypothetical protein
MTIDRGKISSLVGARVSLEEFLGPRYDVTQGRLSIPNISTIPGGYAYAFSDPPYTLYDWRRSHRISEVEATELFHEINRELPGGISSDSIVFQWPDDWSNFFDAGKEWWGSFLWTVANPGSPRICAIAASTTD